MKSLDKKPQGARLERMRTSPRWAGDHFRNAHPIIPDLRDPNAAMPTLGEFICGGGRRVPRGPLPSMSPLDTWAKRLSSGLRAGKISHSLYFPIVGPWEDIALFQLTARREIAAFFRHGFYFVDKRLFFLEQCVPRIAIRPAFVWIP